MNNYSDLLQNLNETEKDELYLKLLRVAQDKLRKERFSDYFTWVQAVWLTARGKPLEFKNRPYLLQIYQDQFPNIVYTKAAQMGLSEKMLSESVWVCDQLDKNVLYTFPTQTHLQDFVQARLDPVLMGSEYLSNRIDKSDTNRMIQKIGLKRIGKGFLYLRGSQNEKQIITIDADMIVLDERDRFDQNSVPFIDKRMLASDLKWRREISTPTLPGMGIDLAYNESDRRVWEIPCKKCGKWQEMDWFQNIDFKLRKLKCKDCGSTRLNRLGEGRWTITNPKNTKVHGYKISGIYNPNRTLDELIDEYNKAKVSGFAELTQFFNQVLGLPYEVTGQSLTQDDLDRCKSDYFFPVAGATDCYAGADVGVKYLHTTVVQKTAENRIRVVWAGTVENFEGPMNSLESILRQYGVKALVVDKRPEVMKVKELMARFPEKVWAAEYTNAKFSVDEYYRWEDIKHELHLDRTITIDYVIGDIQNQRIEFPRNIEVVEDFFDQLKSSVRVTEKNKQTGTDVARYIEKSADHFLHSLNYARLASLRDTQGKALLDYYSNPAKANTVDFFDWIRVKGQRIF